MKAKSNSVMEFTFYMELTEPEMRALEALTVYGYKPFLEMFYKHLGTTYLQPHEQGLISLFESIKKEVLPHMDRIDQTRKVFKDKNPNK